MSDTPVVLLNGARQTGKTTLAQALATRTCTQYFSLDDAATLGLVAGDPFSVRDDDQTDQRLVALKAKHRLG